MYPGSFDPLTYGHLDIIKRASKLCDVLIVAVVTNSGKVPLLSAEERKTLIKEAVEAEGLENIEIVSFSGFLADYVKSQNVTCIVRGLRDISDFTSEIPRACMNKHLYSEFETLFLLANIEHSHLSSSAVKEVIFFNGSIQGLVPENVRHYIEDNKIGRVCDEGI